MAIENGGFKPRPDEQRTGPTGESLAGKEIVPYTGFAVDRRGVAEPAIVTPQTDQRSEIPYTQAAPVPEEDSGAPDVLKKLNHWRVTRNLSADEVTGALIAGHTVETPSGTTADVEMRLDPKDPAAGKDQLKLRKVTLEGNHDIRNAHEGRGTFTPDHPDLRYAHELAQGGNSEAAAALHNVLPEAKRELAKRMIEAEPELAEKLLEHGRSPEEVREIVLSRLNGMRVSPAEKRRLNSRDYSWAHSALRDREEEARWERQSRIPQISSAGNGDWDRGYDDGWGGGGNQRTLPEGQGRTLGPAPLKGLGFRRGNELE